MRRTLQIQRNNIEKELGDFITSCLGKDRNDIEEKAYQNKVSELRNLLD